MSNCHALGTGILLADGSPRNVEDVKVGDHLRGPDSKPREVLELKRGQDEMFRINPEEGESFVVTGHHILNLVCFDNEPPMNVKVNDYVSWEKYVRRLCRLRRVSHPDLRADLVRIKSVERLEAGDYYGFGLSDDHLYLTADHIVHSGKT